MSHSKLKRYVRFEMTLYIFVYINTRPLDKSRLFFFNSVTNINEETL